MPPLPLYRRRNLRNRYDIRGSHFTAELKGPAVGVLCRASSADGPAKFKVSPDISDSKRRINRVQMGAPITRCDISADHHVAAIWRKQMEMDVLMNRERERERATGATERAPWMFRFIGIYRKVAQSVLIHTRCRMPFIVRKYEAIYNT